MITENYRVDFNHEHKFEEILGFLKIENFEKYETFFCDKIYEITENQSKIAQLEQLLAIAL